MASASLIPQLEFLGLLREFTHGTLAGLVTLHFKLHQIVEPNPPMLAGSVVGQRVGSRWVIGWRSAGLRSLWRAARILRCGSALCVRSDHGSSRNPGVSPVVNVRFAVSEREGQPVAVLAFGNPVTERVVVSSTWACHVEFAPPFWCATRKRRAVCSAILSQQLSARAAIPISMSR
jgi:hypothetical protein